MERIKRDKDRVDVQKLKPEADLSGECLIFFCQVSADLLRSATQLCMCGFC
jgi:hypothetical protein